MIVVVAVTALIGVALVKPWAIHGPPPSTQHPIPTAAPLSSEPPPTEVPAPSVTPLQPGQLDATAVAAALANAPIAPRDAWGIRAMLVDPPWVSEVWIPLGPSLIATLGDQRTLAWLGQVGTISGLGVTTPLSDLPLDMRVWRQVGSGWLAQTAAAVTPNDDPSSRLLVLPGANKTDLAWQGGTFRIDLLQEGGVRHIQVNLGGQSTAVAPAGPRQAPSEALLRALAGAPGAFIASGTPAVSYLSAGLPSTPDQQHREAAEWLALGSNDPSSPAYRPTPSTVGSASLIGVAVSANQELVAAFLTMVSPMSRDLGRGQLIAVNDGQAKGGVPAAPRDAVAIFQPPDPASGFPEGSYRIDALLIQNHSPLDMSWDVPLVSDETSTESPLLAALRTWSGVDTAAWAFLAPGFHMLLTPSEAPGLPADPGPNCSGGAKLADSPPYVGVTHAGGPFEAVRAYQLDGPNGGSQVPVQVSQLVNGLVVVRPIAGDWSPGRYVISMRAGATADSVTFCAG